jgi:hypothetical protein
MEKVWIRNPDRIASILSDVGHQFVTWTRTSLNKSKTDPKMFCDLHWGAGTTWEALVIGAGSAVHLDTEHGLDGPRAVYPVWEYGEDWNILEELAGNPISLDAQICSDPVIDVSWRPVYGQEHVIVVTGMPEFSTGVGKAFMRRLSEFQTDYPECTVFVDGSSSYSVMFGMNFRAVNVDPVAGAKGNSVVLPSGRKASRATFVAHSKWIHLLGADIPGLEEEGKRVRFNVKSALWARDNFKKEIVFKSQNPNQQVDPTSQVIELAGSHQLPVAQEGDKLHCDTCSLQMQCKLYRQGSVCTLPKTEAKDLVRMFGSRDAETIIDALGNLVGRQASRVERGMAEEEILGILDPEVGKQLTSTIDNGIKLAKLIDPSRAGGAQVNVNVGAQGSAAQVQMVNPNQMVGQIVREIQQRTGIPAAQITPEMIATQMQLMAGGQQVVAGEVMP